MSAYNKTIHLIRHGMTVANEQKLYCGATNLSLSEKGIAELKANHTLGIYPKNINLYMTSGLKRTNETLNVLYGNVPIIKFPLLEEFHFGTFEMKSYEMLKNDDDYLAWITDEIGTVCCPQGDCRQTFNARVKEGFDSLCAYIESKNAQNHLKESSAMAVLHGGVIVTIMERLFPNIQNFYEWQPKPGRGYTVYYKDNNIYKYVPI